VAGDQDRDHQWMTEINGRSPVSLVRGPVDLVDPVESVESVDLVDLCGFYKQFIADCFPIDSG
jgi:hypothetical protein